MNLLKFLTGIGGESLAKVEILEIAESLKGIHHLYQWRVVQTSVRKLCLLVSFWYICSDQRY